MYVLVLTAHTLDEALKDPWVLQVQDMAFNTLRDELDMLDARTSDVTVALGNATDFGWDAGGASLRLLLDEAQLDAVGDMAAFLAEVISPLSGKEREAQAAALPTAEELIIALGLAAKAAEDTPRRLLGVVRELEVAIALAQRPLEGGEAGAAVLPGGEPQLGALGEPAIASELIAPLGPPPTTKPGVERVLDELANVQTAWSANTSAAAAAATVVPLLSFSSTSPAEARKILGAFAAFVAVLLVVATLAQELAKALGIVLRPLARPRTQLMVLRNSVGIACQVGATAIVSCDPIACGGGVVLIALALSVCWFCARVVRRALGIAGRPPTEDSGERATRSRPRALARFLAVPHLKARGARGVPRLSERLMGRASIAEGVWEDGDAAMSDSFVLTHGNVFENYIGTPADKEATRELPWTVASMRLPCLGVAAKSATLRAGYNVLQLAISATCGVVAGLGAACGENGVCSAAVLGGMGAGTLAQMILAMWLTPYIDRPRHVLDLLSSTSLLGSILCAGIFPSDKTLVIALQIAALCFRVIAVGSTFYKRVLRFAATRRTAHRHRRATLARLSVAQMGLEGGWGGDEESGSISIVNPLAAASGTGPVPSAELEDTGLLPHQASLVMQEPANEGEAGSTAELEAELAEWSRAMSAFSDDARPRLSVTMEDSFESDNAEIFPTGAERQRGATETMNPLYAMMSDSSATLSGGGRGPTWGTAVRLLLALSVSVGREEDASENEAAERLEAELEAMGMVVDIVTQLLSQEEGGSAIDGDSDDAANGDGADDKLWPSLQAALATLNAVQSGEGSRVEAMQALKAVATHVRARCSEDVDVDGATAGGLAALLELLSGARRMLRAVDVDNDPASRLAAARARAMTERCGLERQLSAARTNLRRVRRKGAGWRKVRALVGLLPRPTTTATS